MRAWLGLCLGWATTASAADVTTVIQGRLLDAVGAPVDGTRTLTVTVSDDAAGASVRHTETFTDVPVAGGYYALTLGVGGGLDAAELALPAWVGVAVQGGDALTIAPLHLVPAAAAAVRLASADGRSAGTAARSCLQLRDNGNDRGNGAYWLDPDGPGGLAPYEAWCDMTTAGGGWTLVHRKLGIAFNPIGSAFVPGCAIGGTGDCASRPHPALVWREAMWRFQDTDAYVLVAHDLPGATRDGLMGATTHTTPSTTSLVRWINGVAGPPGTASLTISNETADNAYLSELFAGSDDYLNLWAAYADTTNHYALVEAPALMGRQCIAGYCRNQTAWMLVR